MVKCQCGLRRAKGRRMCAISLSSQLESPAAVSNRIRDGRAMDGGVSGYSTAASSSGGKKRKGETPTGGLVYVIR